MTRFKCTILLLGLLIAAPIPAWCQDATAYLKSGKEKLDKRDAEGALEDFDETIQLKPDWAEAYEERGKTYSVYDLIERNTGVKNTAAKALADFNKAIELDPKYSEAYQGRAGMEIRAKDLDAALADYNKAVECSPKSVLAYGGRAYVKKLMGDSNGALADYDKAIEVQPDGNQAYWAYRDRFKERRDQGDLKGALKDMEKCLQRKPDHYNDFIEGGDYLERGCLKQDTGDLGGALQDFDKAIKLRVEDGKDFFPEAHAARLFARVEKGDMAGAKEDLKAYVGIDEGDVIMIEMVDAPMTDLVRRNAARVDADCTKLLAANPDKMAVYYIRAHARYAEGAYANAVEDFKKVLAVKRDAGDEKAAYYSGFFTLLGRSKLGEQKEALAELQLSVSEPDYDFMNKWCQTIAQFLAEGMNEADFLEAAKKENKFTTPAERECQAYFYAGSKRLLAGDKKGAEEFFAKCVSTNAPDYFEFLAAKMELKALKAVNGK